MSGPLHQFQIEKIFPLEIAGYDVSFTNSALYMSISILLAISFLLLGARKKKLVPGKMQFIVEKCYLFIEDMIDSNASSKARGFIPFVFALFFFIFVGNMIGMVPGAFTFTSHIIVTFAMAMIVFALVTLYALFRHGLKYFSLFMPTGVPILLAPIIIPIEILSYLSRPISLSIRLFANMMAGHTMLKVFAGFTATLGLALGGLGYAIGILPLILNIMIIAFEFLVAFLQAYVFTILTCIYIKDAIELH